MRDSPIAMIGETVGNYRITRLLGQGGMGAVYLAVHPGIGRKAAVKVLHPELARDRDIVTRFLNEARAANAIRHPGIVEIFDSGTLDSGAPYIVMELLEGESLTSRLLRGRLPLDQCLEIARQAAAALGAAHAQGIVHRDLKPDNLFLVPDALEPERERVKVLDFGIAKLNPGSIGAGSVRTRTGAVLGTPVYMSPEQCRGTREIDRRADVYALGVILYEMVCGRPPFYSEGFGELAHLHISEPPPPPRGHAPGLPREVELALLRALEKDPANRFQSMSELRRALGGAPSGQLDQPAEPLPDLRKTETLPKTTFAGSATAFEEKLGRERPRRRAGVVLLGTALVLAGGFWVWQRGLLRVPAREPIPVSVPAPPPPPPPSTEPAHPAVVAPKTVDVLVESTPSGARLVRERDGAVLGQTPFHEAWPAGAGVEKLRLELEGHRPESIVVPRDRGLSTRVKLKTAHEAAPKPKSSKPKTSEPVPI